MDQTRSECHVYSAVVAVSTLSAVHVTQKEYRCLLLLFLRLIGELGVQE